MSLTELSSNIYFKNILPGVLCPALIHRLPLRFDKDADRQGWLGCGTVSRETTSWTVWMEIFWKQETAHRNFSWTENFCPSSACTTGRGSFIQEKLHADVSSFLGIASVDAEASLLVSLSFGFMIFSRKVFIWSNLTKLKFAFNGFDTSTLMSAVEKN